ASSAVEGRPTSPSQRGSTPGCVRRRGRERAVRRTAYAVPRGCRGGRREASRRRPARCASFPPAWHPPPSSFPSGVHVGHGERGRVLRGIGRALGLAVAAHVPADDAEAVGEGRPLAVPQSTGGGVAVAQQKPRATPALLALHLDDG